MKDLKLISLVDKLEDELIKADIYYYDDIGEALGELQDYIEE